MDIVKNAVSVLIHDGLIVYPTDTVYGLGADALSDEAIIKVYEAKNRPIGMPISIAVADFDMLASVSRTDPWMQEFIGTFLPGPVTVVLPARRFIPDVLTGGTGLIGVRIPANDIALQIIRQFDGPITATSANLHGARDPVAQDQVTVPYELFVDGGKLHGTPSTVVDLLTRTIIRRGTYADTIEEFLSRP